MSEGQEATGTQARRQATQANDRPTRGARTRCESLSIEWPPSLPDSAHSVHSVRSVRQWRTWRT